MLDQKDLEAITWVLETIPGKTVGEIVTELADEVYDGNVTQRRMFRALVLIIDNLVTAQAKMASDIMGKKITNENVFQSLAHSYSLFLTTLADSKDHNDD